MSSEETSGEVGSLLCTPMYMDFLEASGMAFGPLPAYYCILFSIADDENRSDSSATGKLNKSGRYIWDGKIILAVKDKIADKALSLTLIKLDHDGFANVYANDNVKVARGIVPTEKLDAIYTGVSVPSVSFPIEMKSMDG